MPAKRIEPVAAHPSTPLHGTSLARRGRAGGPWVTPGHEVTAEGAGRASTRRGGSRHSFQAGDSPHAGTTLAPDESLTALRFRDDTPSEVSPESGVECVERAEILRELPSLIAIVLCMVTALGWPIDLVALLSEIVR